jgi:hypothetical protein
MNKIQDSLRKKIRGKEHEFTIFRPRTCRYPYKTAVSIENKTIPVRVAVVKAGLWLNGVNP